MNTNTKLSFGCVENRDGSRYCGPPPGVCVVTKCHTAADGSASVCVQLPEPCAVPTLPIAAVAALVIGLVVAAWRRV
jgi:hypothetical protein